MGPAVRLLLQNYQDMPQNTFDIGHNIFISNMNYIYSAMRQHCITLRISSDDMSVPIYFNSRVFLRAEKITNPVIYDSLATEFIPRKL